MILFLLGITCTLSLLFAIIIYIYLIADDSLFSKNNKKKEEIDITKLEVKEKVDSKFWG